MTDLFKEKAQDWDATDMIKQLSTGIGRSIIDNVTLHDQMNVMDFGAGTGLITAQIAPLVNKVTAVDISSSMLEQLVAKVGLKEKVEILCQDILSQPTGAYYDLIMSAMAIHHVEDTDQIIEKFASHLKPGAQIALADLDKEDGTFHPSDVEGVYHDGFERSHFQELLEKHGFKDIGFKTAHRIQKEETTYPVFLVIATKA